jgi:hypothetical protein
MRITKGFYYYFGFIILMFFLHVISSSSCQNDYSEADLNQIDQINNLFDEIPVHPGKTELQAQTKKEVSGTAVVRKYRSNVSFEETRSFYLDRLPGSGWQFTEERELKDRGRHRGERVVEFQKGGFVLSVQFAGNRRESLGWDYAVRLAFPADNKRKV